jgi:hypothetical protein
MISLSSRIPLSGKDQYTRHSAQSMALLRSPGLRKKCSCFVFHDGRLPADHVEISLVARLPRRASRHRSSLPNILSRRDVAGSRPVLHSRDEGHTHRRGPRDRWNSRVSALYSGSWASCYFGASEATIFSKRGSPRSESQYGCSLRNP